MKTKATLYLDPKVHRALKARAAKSGKTVSYTANDILDIALGYPATSKALNQKVTVEYVGKYGLPVYKGLRFPKNFSYSRADLYD